MLRAFSKKVPRQYRVNLDTGLEKVPDYRETFRHILIRAGCINSKKIKKLIFLNQMDMSNRYFYSAAAYVLTLTESANAIFDLKCMDHFLRSYQRSFIYDIWHISYAT